MFLCCVTLQIYKNRQKTKIWLLAVCRIYWENMCLFKDTLVILFDFIFEWRGKYIFFFCSDRQIVHSCPNFPASGSHPALFRVLQLSALFLQSAPCNIFPCVRFPCARFSFVPALLPIMLYCLHLPPLRWSRDEDLWLPLSLNSWSVPCAVPLLRIPFSSCKDLVACLVSDPPPSFH